MRAVVLLPLLLVAAAPPVAAPAVHHATGTFEPVITPEAETPASDGVMPTARMGVIKLFTGGMAGTARGTMLAVGSNDPGQPAAYVAIDQFRGTVDGRSGGFMLLHRGTIAASGHSELAVTIAPDSGTGQLAGISGALTIVVAADGHHSYDLAYSLPVAH